jgi:hypothetical protein
MSKEAVSAESLVRVCGEVVALIFKSLTAGNLLPAAAAAKGGGAHAVIV